MPTRDDLTKWRAALRATFPVVGSMRRKWAIHALESHRNDRDVVPLLIEALGLGDELITGRAATALSGLTAQPAVDALCGLWAETRDERLGQIIAQQKYIANEPVQLKILTSLKCGKPTTIDRPGVISFFISLLEDPDRMVRTAAMRSLEQVLPGAAQDALCDEAVKNPTGTAAKLCLAKGKRPSDHERLCLFLFVTRQLDEYFKEDFEFQNLRLQYDRADATVRTHVMAVIRAGDRRCAGFFGTRSKPVVECTEAEIKLAIDSWQPHRDWDRLFHACLELPLKYSLPAFALLARSNWQPESPDLMNMYHEILADLGNKTPPSPTKANPTGSLFEQWLARGSSGELAKLAETALCQRLKTASPPDGVAIVAALAAKRPSRAATVQAVRENPHWLVRLAGHAAGLIAPDPTQVSVEDFNYWITELVSAPSVLEFWPGKATPADVEAIPAAPPEAWVGRLGAARKVLRRIISYRITSGTFEPMVIEADEYAGEFVQATDVKFDRGKSP